MHLFKISKEQIQGDRLLVEQEDFIHLKKVLRKKAGEIIFFTDGRMIYETRISCLGSRDMECRITGRRPVPDRGRMDLDLYLSMIQASRMETILDQATQLGVSRIIPVLAEYSQNLPLKADRFRRWERIIREAAKQSFNPTPPVLSQEVIPFRSVLILNSFRILLQPGADKGLKEVLPRPEPERISLIIGPEAGFSVREVERASGNGMHICRMPYPVLRSETAVIAAVSNVLFFYH